MDTGTQASVMAARAIKNEALRLGFAACGFSAAARLDQETPVLQNWLDNGGHAGMAYMANSYNFV